MYYVEYPMTEFCDICDRAPDGLHGTQHADDCSPCGPLGTYNNGNLRACYRCVTQRPHDGESVAAFVQPSTVPTTFDRLDRGEAFTFANADIPFIHTKLEVNEYRNGKDGQVWCIGDHRASVVRI